MLCLKQITPYGDGKACERIVSTLIDLTKIEAQ